MDHGFICRKIGVLVLFILLISCQEREFLNQLDPKVPKTISISVSPPGSGQILLSPGGPNYASGEIVNLLPSPNQNWIFQNWDGDASGTTVPFNLNMDVSKSVVANFISADALKAKYPEGSKFCESGPTLIMDVTNPSTGKTWMDRNLGAARVAANSNDSQAFGDLYQWGRGNDGHQCRSSKTSSTLSNTNQPSHGDFILATVSPHDWRSPQNTNLWQGVSGVNNPCPIGYRIPTEAELNSERLSWSTNNAKGAFESKLKFPLPGGRNESFGTIGGMGIGANYWSSTLMSGYSKLLAIEANNSSISFYIRGVGNSVRCIKN